MTNNDMEQRLDQLLAGLPKPQYDTNRWLMEDHTAEFDRIAGQRRSKAWGRRLAVTAAVIGVLCMTGITLKKQTETPQTVVIAHEMKQPTAPQMEPQPEEPVLAAVTPTETKSTKPAAAKTKQAKPVTVSHTSMTPIDSLTDIIAHIEASMQSVRDSCYMANVKKLMRFDDRLQRLVNDLILEGLMSEQTASRIERTSR